MAFNGISGLIASLKDKLAVLQIDSIGVVNLSLFDEHRKMGCVIADRNCVIEQNDKSRS